MRGATARVRPNPFFDASKVKNIRFFQARQLMLMWESAVGLRATPEAMVQTLRKIPIATDIVDRIKEHCEWIHIILQALAFFAQASREEGLVPRRGQPRYSKGQ